VKEHYAPPAETSPELDVLVARMNENDDTKAWFK
jgi:hypothetical protein